MWLAARVHWHAADQVLQIAKRQREITLEVTLPIIVDDIVGGYGNNVSVLVVRVYAGIDIYIAGACLVHVTDLFDRSACLSVLADHAERVLVGGGIKAGIEYTACRLGKLLTESVSNGSCRFHNAIGIITRCLSVFGLTIESHHRGLCRNSVIGKQVDTTIGISQIAEIVFFRLIGQGYRRSCQSSLCHIQSTGVGGIL